MQGNGDFTSERVVMMQRINQLKHALKLEPKEFMGLLSIIDTYSKEDSLPDGWLQCEDVLFESLARMLKCTSGVADTSIETWLGSKLCDAFFFKSRNECRIWS